jgi:molybdopterin converting factor small subunit
MKLDNGLDNNAVSKIQVQLYGQFGEAAGRSADEVGLSAGATVSGLLGELADAYGRSFRDEIFDSSGGLRDDVMVTVNKAIVKHEDAAEIKMEPGDSIALFPIFHGGG